MINTFFVHIFTPHNSSEQCTEHAFLKESTLVLLIHSTEHSFKLSTPATVNNFKALYNSSSLCDKLLQETCFEILLKFGFNLTI